MKVQDVARLLNVSENTVYRWVKKGDIPTYRVDEQYHFHRAEVLEWATARKIPVSADIFKKADSPPPKPLCLTEAVRAGGVIHRLGGSDKKAVIRAAVEAMRLPDGLDREELLRLLLAREDLASTGIGEGIAIPHVRNPIVLHVVRPTITLCFLEKPVDFGVMDNRPVHCLFMLISPTVRAHLLLLARLGFALRDAAFKAAIKRQGSRDEVLAELGRVETGMDQAEGNPR